MMPTWAWVVASVAMYLVGAGVMFRIIYLKETEKLYAKRLDQYTCSGCAYELEYHAARQDMSVNWGLIFWVTVCWPFIAVGFLADKFGRGLRVLLKRIIFPTGIKTPSKLEWESKKLEEKRDADMRKLQHDAEKLGLPFPTPEALEARRVERDEAQGQIRVQTLADREAELGTLSGAILSGAIKLKRTKYT